MSSTRLQQQFIRLWQCCEGQSQQTTLHELATRLNCTRRHMRNLLNAMQEKGWLTWQAEAGRGRRSTLSFLYTGLALQQQRAGDLLDQDRTDLLMQIVGDKNAMRRMVLSHLGRSFRQGRHILRVLYYRPLQNLLPGSALRRSETHIVRQIFSALTLINEENGEIQPDIAHHWQQITPLHWRFFLRPGIHFHHGRELEMQDVLSTLERIRPLLLYRHITRIVSPTHWTLDIHLSEPDIWLPWLMGNAAAMILPHDWNDMPDFSRLPVGTGPYAVVRNNNNQLKIHAFDEYFGYRALIDEVNFWVLPDLSEEMSSGIHLEGNIGDEKAVESRPEEGCYYLLFDKRSTHVASLQVRRWLSQVLFPATLLSHTSQQRQRYWFPAYGLLPRWHHVSQTAPVERPDGLETLTLTFYRDHIEHRVIATLIETLLAQYQVHAIVNEVSYEAWHQGEQVSDCWLNRANFTLPLEFSLFGHLYEMPLMHHCIDIDWQQDAERWHAGQLSLPQWCQQRVERLDIFPLFHHWLTIEGQRSMRGVRMNALGWFDFKSAWFAPPEPDTPSGLS